MKNGFVHGGYFRFLRGKSTMESESIERQYAAALARAGPAEKIQIRERMPREFARRKRMDNHEPSPGTLW